MLDSATLDDLEAKDGPLFYCEPVPAPGPDPRMWPELARQAAFIAFIRKSQPQLFAYALTNAGKRGPKAIAQAKAEGLIPGVFDTLVCWDVRTGNPDAPATVAWIEWKGFDKTGRPGKLSPAQIEFGNRKHRMGLSVACFYTVKGALQWLASLGAPIRGAVA